MSADHMTADRFGLTLAEVRACRLLDISPTAVARERRRRLLHDPQEEHMTTEPALTDDEKDICSRSGMDPARYAAIRDTPTSFGGRSVSDVQAALTAPTPPKED